MVAFEKPEVGLSPKISSTKIWMNEREVDHCLVSIIDDYECVKWIY